MEKLSALLWLCLLFAGALASCSRLPSVAAWHPDPARPDAIGSLGNGNIHATSALHHHQGHALPPLSAPPLTAGADLPPSHAPGQQPAPHFGFPLQPASGSAVPPSGVGEGYPFIGSNPTVPLPTGMTDTTTVLPMPDTGAGTATTKEVGYAASVPAPITIIVLALFFSILFLSSNP